MDALDISRYRSWLLANPSAFVEGVRGFCKQAQTMRLSPDDPQYRFAMTQGNRYFRPGDPGYENAMALANRVRADDDEEDDDRSLWDKIKPWVIGLGGGYLALKAGDKWGRFAQKHGYKQGPVVGPFVAAVGSLLRPEHKLQGTLTQEEANANGQGQ